MAIIFTGTTKQMMNWCRLHYHQAVASATPVSVPHTQGISHVIFSMLPLWAWIGLAIICYGLGRIGLSQAWSDLKSVYSSIRSFFSGTSTSTSTTATTTSKTVA